MKAGGISQTHLGRIWPLPWWSALSVLALVCVCAALTGVLVTWTGRPAASTEWPTPVLITVTPAAGQATPKAGESPGALGQFETGDLVRVSGTGGLDLRIRVGPGTLYETAKLVPEGTPLEITGEPRQADNYVWWPVRDPSDGAQGWVVSDYVRGGAPK